MAGLKLPESQKATEHIVVTKLQKEVLFSIASVLKKRNVRIIQDALRLYLDDMIVHASDDLIKECGKVGFNKINSCYEKLFSDGVK